VGDLVIKNVPDELCCAYGALSDEERGNVLSELADSIREALMVRPHHGDLARYMEEIRRFRERNTLQPLTDEFIEEAIAGGRR